MYFKKFLLASICMFLFMFGQSQFQKGDRMVGVSVANLFYTAGTADQTVGSVGTLNYKTTDFGLSISPSMGWFISEKTAVGGLLNINPTSHKVAYESNNSTFQQDKSNNFNIGIGAFARHYLNAGSTFLPYGQLDVNGGINTATTEGFFYGGIGSGTYKETYEGKASGGSFLNASINLGLTKMVGTNAGLDIFIGYNFSSSKNTFKTTKLRDDGNNGTIETRSENTTTTHFTSHGAVIGVSFQVFLKKKK